MSGTRDAVHGADVGSLPLHSHDIHIALFFKYFCDCLVAGVALKIHLATRLCRKSFRKHMTADIVLL